MRPTSQTPSFPFDIAREMDRPVPDETVDRAVKPPTPKGDEKKTREAMNAVSNLLKKYASN